MIITLSRQYLAGADKVAEGVAAELGWTVVDDAFIETLAERSGFDREDVKGLEERVPTFMERFAQSSALSMPELLASAPDAIAEPEAIKLAHITRDLVTELGRRDRVVLVGRAAAAVLARERDAIHVFLVASVAYRVKEAMRRYGMSESQARAAVSERDSNRARYHRELYQRVWADPVNYHFVLNTELLGTEGAAAMILSRARALGWR
ncbi:MAG: cytidylate kinase-like family protein [Deltaproteobacteria bacterium]|nr:cytidylate kinase-like family protein [Deltaproteobacteria bacterium]